MGRFSAQATCPVHVLGHVVECLPCGVKLFDGITAGIALAELRRVLGEIGVKDAAAFRTQDLRRGHALDLQLSGAPLWAILSAGEWKSPAFLQYLDMHRLETELVVQAHLDESEGEGDVVVVGDQDR